MGDDFVMIISKANKIITFRKPQLDNLKFVKKAFYISMKCMVEDVSFNEIKRAWKN
jgi:hypothetical protein